DLRDVLRGLDLWRRDVDASGEDVLALEQREQRHRHPGACALERDLVDAAAREVREGELVLAPLVAEAALPGDVRLDPVAVADVHRGGAGDAVDGAVQRLDAPVADLVDVDVEGGLVELDDVDAEVG